MVIYLNKFKLAYHVYMIYNQQAIEVYCIYMLLRSHGNYMNITLTLKSVIINLCFKDY